MSAERQALAEAEILQPDRIREGEPPSVLKHLAREGHPESRIQELTIVLERLWLFHEAMHSGKPLANADEMLAQIGTALRIAGKTRTLVNCDPLTSW
jgi:hypothetical protein